LLAPSTLIGSVEHTADPRRTSDIPNIVLEEVAFSSFAA
jgi:hypothetical protein